MKDILLKHIEMNEAYHDTKEKMAWIASSVYFTFSLFILNWLFKNRHLCSRQQLLLAITLIFIYICTLCFISLQFKSRWDSVNKSIALKEVLKTIISDDLMSSFPYRNDIEVKKIKKLENIKYHDKKENKTIIARKRSWWIITILTIIFPFAPIGYFILRVIECIVTVAHKQKIWRIVVLAIFFPITLICYFVLRVIQCIVTVEHKLICWIKTVLIILSFMLIFYFILRIMECIDRKKQKKYSLKFDQRYKIEIDTRYHTEIPTYSISTIFLLAQLYLIYSNELNRHIDYFLKLLGIGA